MCEAGELKAERTRFHGATGYYTSCRNSELRVKATIYASLLRFPTRVFFACLQISYVCKISRAQSIISKLQGDLSRLGVILGLTCNEIDIYPETRLLPDLHHANCMSGDNSEQHI